MGGVAVGHRAEACALPGAGLGDPGADGGGGFPGAAVGKGFKLQGRHLGEKINPVQQRAGELAQVTLHLGRRYTGTGRRDGHTSRICRGSWHTEG